MPPENAIASGELARALQPAIVRLVVRHVSIGLAAAVVVALVVRLVGFAAGWPARWGVLAGVLVALAVVICLLIALRGRRTNHAAALALERGNREAHNVIVTAEELERHPERAAPWLRGRIRADALKAAAASDLGVAVPHRWTMAALTVVAAGLAIHLGWTGERSPVELLRAAADAVLPGRAAAVSELRVTVQPPEYAGLERQELTDPERLDVLEGSRITVVSRPGARIRLGESELGSGQAEFVARSSGYLAVDDAERAGRRLVALDVRPDRAPVVRVEVPAKDLLLPDGKRSIPVTISATDDLALRSVDLRFTKVSGSGEQFEFVEGQVPVRIERRSERDWRASATLDLAPLALGPGDSVVYRATSSDARPGGAGLASSDTYFVEIMGPGQVALEGVDMPPELERYAMSQQMIVVKIERLRARQAGLPAETLTEEAAGLAAEQRTVRANFIFLLGGHVEDEEEEAEQSHEIQEGRLENTARKDINTAIGQMTRAEQALTAVDTGAALPPARAAVEALQRAFGRSRYLLRALAARSRLDPTRRLTGNMADAGSWRRVLDTLETNGRPDAVDVHASLLAAAGEIAAGRVPAAHDVNALAERVLSVDPASNLWREVSRGLLVLGQRQPTAAEWKTQIESLLARVDAEARRTMPPRGPAAAGATELKRAYSVEIRR